MRRYVACTHAAGLSPEDRRVIIAAHRAGARFASASARAAVREHEVACARCARAIYEEQQRRMPGLKLGRPEPAAHASAARAAMPPLPIGRGAQATHLEPRRLPSGHYAMPPLPLR